MTEKITVPDEREGTPALEDLAERRKMISAAVEAGLMPSPERPVAEEIIGGVRTLTVSPEGKAPRGYMVMLHGGGYRIGRPENDTRFAEMLADRCNIEVVLPAYRLAPENPFPSGFNDAWSILNAVASRIGNAPLMVGGDSAGGGLAAALGVYAGSQGSPRIAAALLLSPFVDLTITAASFQENAETDQLFPKASAKDASELYLQGFDPRHPLASPLFAQLSSFPPTFINVGTGEALRDDSISFHEKLEKAGVPSQLQAIDDMEHVAVVRNMGLIGSAESLEAIVAFINGVTA